MDEFELEPGETITTQVRQHIVVLLLKLVPYAVLAILPIFVTSAIAAAGGGSLSGTVRFFLGIWWLFMWMGAFTTIMMYHLTYWVITSQRIVDIRQFGFFKRKVSSFLLVRVQDVTTDVHGFFGTLIGFGDLNVETAGRDEKFVLNGLGAPEWVRDLIMREVAALHPAVDDTTAGV